MTKRVARSPDGDPKRSKLDDDDPQPFPGEQPLCDPRLEDGSDTDYESDEDISFTDFMMDGVLPDDFDENSTSNHQFGQENRPEDLQTDQSVESIKVIDGVEPVGEQKSQSGSGNKKFETNVLYKGEKRLDFFRTTHHLLKINVKFNIDSLERVVFNQYKDQIAEWFNDICQESFNKHDKSKYYWITISSPAFIKYGPFTIGGESISNFNKYEFADAIFKGAQSFESFLIKEMTIEIFVLDRRDGGTKHKKGPKARRARTTENRISGMNAVTTIHNKDNSCGFRALALGHWFISNNLQRLNIGDDPELSNEWARLTKNYKGQYSDAHQFNLMKSFLKRVNTFFHIEKHREFAKNSSSSHRCRISGWCDVCDYDPIENPDPVAKCAEEEHCYYWECPRFRRNVRFGSQIEDFSDMEKFLSSIGMHLTIFDKEDKMQLFHPSELIDGNGDLIVTKFNTIFLVREEITDGYGQNGGHFDYLKRVEPFLMCDNYCFICNKGFNWSQNHVCGNICRSCGKTPQCIEDKKVRCDACKKVFNNSDCYEFHLTEESKFYCKLSKECQECGLVYAAKYDSTSRPHRCFKRVCKSCGKQDDYPHQCYMKTLDKAKLIQQDKINKIIVIFDIESELKLNYTNQTRMHEAILLASKTICDNCWNFESNDQVFDSCQICKSTIENNCMTCQADGKKMCGICGSIGTKLFHDYDCIREFAQYIYMELSPIAEKLNSQVLVFAHNSQGYDGHFILQDLFERRFEDQPNIIMKGSKILQLQVNNVRFMDSICFFPSPLASLPKMFGFPEMEKGYFPYLYPRPDSDEVTSIPDKTLFQPEYMKPRQRQEFETWYQEYKDSGRGWRWLEELEKYCKNDVEILTKAVQLYRKANQDMTGLDPYTRNFTLASFCLEHFKADVLEENSIGITPVEGYINNRNQSMIANVWLDYKEKSENIKIKREMQLGRYFADGFRLDEEEKNVYEFLGCRYHGCKRCFRNREKVIFNKTVEEKYEEWTEKKQWYEDHDYNLEYVWECKFKKMMNKKPNQRRRIIDDANDPEDERDGDGEDLDTEEFRTFAKERYAYYVKMNQIGDLDLRDGFFGGRTNNLSFFHEFTGTQIGRYLDVTSLYPYVLTKRQYPIGHPKIITQFTDNDISNYFGFIRCKVEAPRDLFIPVLPYRKKNKRLVFPLCKICADDMNDVCEHEGEERHFIGTWFSKELELALRKGYRIIEIYQVFHWSETSSDIYTGYYKVHYKEKAEASGFPSWAVTEEQKDQFIEEFERRENIRLDKDKIVKNSARRAVSKLNNNSLWGKMAQQQQKQKTAICQTYNQFINIIGDKQNEIKGIVVANHKTIIVNYKVSDIKYAKAGNTNIAIAAMVTGWARIHLYEVMDEIEKSCQGRVLYFDTDSIIYIDDPSKDWYNPPIGDFLGDMTDEIAKDYEVGSKMVEFVSAGPKNYGYIVETPDGLRHATIKVKGINLNSTASGILTFSLMKKFAQKFHQENVRQLPPEDDSENSTRNSTNAHFYQAAETGVRNIPQLKFNCSKQHSISSEIAYKKYRVVSEKRFPVSGHTFIQTLPYGFKQFDE